MVFSAYLILVLLACGLTLVSGITNRVPLWVAVLLLCVALLLERGL